MHYRYLLAKHLDRCQRQILDAYDVLNSFLLNLESTTRQAGVNHELFQVTLKPTTDILKSASDLVSSLQTEAYGSPTITTDTGGVLFVKNDSTGRTFATTEDPLAAVDDLPEPVSGGFAGSSDQSYNQKIDPYELPRNLSEE